MEKTPNGSDKPAVTIKKASLKSSILRGSLFALAFIVFAYGFKVTRVSFEQINSPDRQASLTRVLRAIAKPEILEYEKIEKIVELGVYVPCQAGARIPEPASPGEPYLVMTPACANPRSAITLEGFNFEPFSSGPAFFIPSSEVKLKLGDFESGADGRFKIETKLPPRPDEAMQTIQAVTRINTGAPYFTQTARQTWGKIIETVFLALLATVFGIILAVPVSFFAAQNLMREITAPMSSLALAVLGWPVGMYAGAVIAGWIRTLSERLTGNPLLTLAGLGAALLLIWFLGRWAFPSEEEEKRPSLAMRLSRMAATVVVAVAAIFFLYMLASIAIVAGELLEERLGSLDFLGAFVSSLGEILHLLVVLIAALAGGAAFSGLLARLGTLLYRSLPKAWIFVANVILGAAAGAMVAGLLAAGLNWLYEFNNYTRVFTSSLLVGAALGILVAVLTRKRDAIPVGIVVYTITRTILNVLRAIEALIWVIIFVVWVGIGPFAGVLALTLHTIAALGKLYSEQVESILPGPLEAVKATGATRLQTIMYAVIPQIVPPYISFTIYRWDINVRMSTIIGFAGGGGIGFLLFQNINLLNYRAASAQMFAIAVVVALMDYFSAWLRNKVV